MPDSILAALAKAADVRRLLPFEERVIREGLPYATSAAFTGTAAVNATWGSQFMLPGLTRAFWCETAVVTSNRNLVVQIKTNGEALGSGTSDAIDVVVGPGGPVTIPMRKLYRPSQYASSGALGNGVIRALLGDTDYTNAQIRINLTGVSITDDLNYEAAKTVLVVGDSITGPGTGPTAKTNQWDWRLLAYLKSLGVDLRLLNQSMSGTTSTNAERRRAHGDYDHSQVDHIVYAMGANDAGQSVSTATYKANVAAAITWKKKRYPDATMHVFGVTPLENNTSEMNAAALRTAASEAVSEATDAKVRYCNLGGAFDRTVSSNYASTDSAGSRVHPNDAGHAAIWGVVQPFMQANPVLV